jgi:predicted patatin/cPLA2 family phospholipase
MELDKHTGLVLEGGGMRGAFTGGVLDWLLDHNMMFPYTVGVSAGACNGMSYMSRQRGRARFTNVDMMEEHCYIGLKFWWRQRSLLDQNLLYKVLPESLYPYDFEAYKKNPNVFEMVTVNCHTGTACYLSERENYNRLIRICKASSSLPYVCPIVMLDHMPMLDGGIVDSIPVARAESLGYKKNVVVLTRNRGYRKSTKDIRIPSLLYRRFPRLREALSRRCECYNSQLDYVERLEEEGKIVVVRPERPVVVDRMEKDAVKLRMLYDEGYKCAERVLGSLKTNL